MVPGAASNAARIWSVLIIVVFAGITFLLFRGYRATREWEDGVTTRIAHQTEESANLILTAIKRDMSGAQSRILANRDWDTPLPIDDADLETTEQVATTFARYPYPESFFTWRGDDHHMIFFSRSTRLPRWMPEEITASESPITIVSDPPLGELIRQRVRSYIVAQQQYAVFNTELAGMPYQIVARINYEDALREHVQSVSGFTVNLDWIRRQYFSDIFKELGPTVSGGLKEDVSLIDDTNHVIVGSAIESAPTAERTFPLLFVDTFDAAQDLTDEMTTRSWRLRVSAANDPMLLSARRRTDVTLLATVTAVVVCGFSMLLARRTVTHDARLVEMRSRFVSSVTHDLKTPLANIHALASTLEREAQVTSDRYKNYPQLLVQEAASLSRMVDNLLAYARITDVSETCAFEPIAAAELIDEAARSFRPRLQEIGVTMDVDTSADWLFVRADQRAMVLALKNLIDNALRHARAGGGHVRVAARAVAAMVRIEVADDGSGISDQKLAALRESIASRAFAPSDGGGLGLAIASRIVADHGGTLTVDSAPGQGTLCVIGLPVC